MRLLKVLNFKKPKILWLLVGFSHMGVFKNGGSSPIVIIHLFIGILHAAIACPPSMELRWPLGYAISSPILSWEPVRANLIGPLSRQQMGEWSILLAEGYWE